MSNDQRRGVWWLGLCQCVLWGLLYYSFSVLLVPLEQGLSLPRTIVVGAYSLGLLVMAFIAPRLGRAFDKGHATAVFRIGVLVATAGLVVLSLTHGPLLLYVAWVLLGTAMAMLLYESAFALVIRAVADPRQRLNALATVTVIGGLASTIFLPAVGRFVVLAGWRRTALACAFVVLIIAAVMERLVLPALARPQQNLAARTGNARRWPAHFRSVVAVFSLSTLASMALTTLLIPMLLARGSAATAAAMTLGMLGIAQIPGRIWVLRGPSDHQHRILLMLPALLQAAGLGVIVLSHSLPSTGGGVALFGLGAGLQTLARPWLVQALYGRADAGRWNGELARIQGFARAIGPVLAAALAWLGGTPLVLTTLGLLLTASFPLGRRLLSAVPQSSTPAFSDSNL